MRPRVLLSWSSGKDAAWTLHKLRLQNEVDVVGLLTVLGRAQNRIAMHGVREILLEAQARSVGIPLWKIYIPEPCPPNIYDQEMSELIERARLFGITQIAFGDIHLEQVRKNREEKLGPTGIMPIFPLWGSNPLFLAHEMVAAGLRAVLVSVDPKHLDSKFCGRIFDAKLISKFPHNIDPCGEQGEFHTFAFAGPMYRRPVPFLIRDTIMQDGFYYTDLVPEISSCDIPRHSQIK
ncbi:MAG: hypothetical protein WCK42_05935 [Myxococcaceae bacterium]